MTSHYLDYNATAPVRPEVLARMHELQGLALNASSTHAGGRRAKSVIEEARRAIGEAVGAFAGEVAFTSSGSEANNWVLRSLVGHALFVSAVEHSSVLKTAQALGNPGIIAVGADGVIDLAAFEQCLPREGPFLASVMLANNETGVIQPVREAAEIIHRRGGLLHCDAVQGLGKIPVDFTALGADFMTIAGHKMGGPVGAAALVIKNGIALKPLLTGGGQESNRRAGSENVAAIAGFGMAVERIDFAAMKRLQGWLGGFEREVQNVSRETMVLGNSASRLPNTLCLTMPGVAAETQLISFDLAGIAVSAGSACSSGRIEPSHVLKAMGLDDKTAATAIRISGGWATTQADVEALSREWRRLFLSKQAA